MGGVIGKRNTPTAKTKYTAGSSKNAKNESDLRSSLQSNSSNSGQQPQRHLSSSSMYGAQSARSTRGAKKSASVREGLRAAIADSFRSTGARSVRNGAAEPQQQEEEAVQAEDQAVEDITEQSVVDRARVRGVSWLHSMLIMSDHVLVFCADRTVHISNLMPEGQDLEFYRFEERKVREFKEHKRTVRCITLHPNGLMIASGETGRNGSIFVWNSRSLDVQARLRSPHVGGIGTLCFCSKGDLLASVGCFPSSGTGDYQISIWLWYSNELVANVKGQPDAVVDAAFAGHDVLVSASATHIRYWDVLLEDAEEGVSEAASRGKIVRRRQTEMNPDRGAVTCLLGMGEGGVVVGDESGGLSWLNGDGEVLSYLALQNGPVGALCKAHGDKGLSCAMNQALGFVSLGSGPDHGRMAVASIVELPAELGRGSWSEEGPESLSRRLRHEEAAGAVVSCLQDDGEGASIRSVTFLWPVLYFCFDGGARRLGPGEIHGFHARDESVSLVQVLPMPVDAPGFASMRIDSGRAGSTSGGMGAAEKMDLEGDAGVEDPAFLHHQLHGLEGLDGLFWSNSNSEGGASGLLRVRSDPGEDKGSRAARVSPLVAATGEQILEVEHVHGYRGYDALNNIVLVERGGSVWAAFPAGTMVVLQEVESVEQEVFSEHQWSVICLAAHSDGVTLASGDRLPALQTKDGDEVDEQPGEAGGSASIVVWSADTLEVLMKIRGVDEGGVGAISFCDADGIDGARLAVMGLGASHVISVWDWRSGTKLASVRGQDGARTLAVKFLPGTGSELVSCGAKHVTFWRLHAAGAEATPSEEGSTAGSVQGELDAAQRSAATTGLLDEEPLAMTGRQGMDGPTPVTANMLCISFPLRKSREHQQLTVTGSEDGGLYLWSGAFLTRVVPAHAGPVLSAWADSLGFVSGGADGMILAWDWEVRSIVERAKVSRRRSLMPVKGGDLEDIGTEDVRSVVRWGEWMVAGTSRNAVYKVLMGSTDGDGKDGGSKVTKMAGGHGCGQCAGLDVDRTGNVAYSIGGSGAVRAWNVEERRLMATRRVGDKGSAVALSEDLQHLAVGHGNKGLSVIFTESLADHAQLWVPACVSCLQFSPGDQLLGAGMADGAIAVFRRRNEYKLVGMINGHSGPVRCMDWSIGSEMEMMRSRSDLVGDERVWAVPSMTDVTGSDGLGDVKWATTRCRAIEMAAQEVLGGRFSHAVLLPGHLVLGDVFGRMLSCPMRGAGEGKGGAAMYFAHGMPVSTICLAQKGRKLISFSCQDGTLVQWRVTDAGCAAVDDDDDEVATYASRGMDEEEEAAAPDASPAEGGDAPMKILDAVAAEGCVLSDDEEAPEAERREARAEVSELDQADGVEKEVEAEEGAAEGAASDGEEEEEEEEGEGEGEEEEPWERVSKESSVVSDGVEGEVEAAVEPGRGEAVSVPEEEEGGGEKRSAAKPATLHPGDAAFVRRASNVRLRLPTPRPLHAREESGDVAEERARDCLLASDEDDPPGGSGAQPMLNVALAGELYSPRSEEPAAGEDGAAAAAGDAVGVDPEPMADSECARASSAASAQPPRSPRRHAVAEPRPVGAQAAREVQVDLLPAPRARGIDRGTSAESPEPWVPPRPPSRSAETQTEEELAAPGPGTEPGPELKQELSSELKLELRALKQELLASMAQSAEAQGAAAEQSQASGGARKGGGGAAGAQRERREGGRLEESLGVAPSLSDVLDEERWLEGNKEKHRVLLLHAEQEWLRQRLLLLEAKMHVGIQPTDAYSQSPAPVAFSPDHRPQSDFSKSRGSEPRFFPNESTLSSLAASTVAVHTPAEHSERPHVFEESEQHRATPASPSAQPQRSSVARRVNMESDAAEEPEGGLSDDRRRHRAASSAAASFGVDDSKNGASRRTQSDSSRQPAGRGVHHGANGRLSSGEAPSKQAADGPRARQDTRTAMKASLPAPRKSPNRNVELSGHRQQAALDQTADGRGSEGRGQQQGVGREGQRGRVVSAERRAEEWTEEEETDEERERRGLETAKRFAAAEAELRRLEAIHASRMQRRGGGGGERGKGTGRGEGGRADSEGAAMASGTEGDISGHGSDASLPTGAWRPAAEPGRGGGVRGRDPEPRPGSQDGTRGWREEGGERPRPSRALPRRDHRAGRGEERRGEARGGGEVEATDGAREPGSGGEAGQLQRGGSAGSGVGVEWGERTKLPWALESVGSSSAGSSARLPWEREEEEELRAGRPVAVGRSPSFLAFSAADLETSRSHANPARDEPAPAAVEEGDELMMFAPLDGGEVARRPVPASQPQKAEKRVVRARAVERRKVSRSPERQGAVGGGADFVFEEQEDAMAAGFRGFEGIMLGGDLVWTKSMPVHEDGGAAAHPASSAGGSGNLGLLEVSRVWGCAGAAGKANGVLASGGAVVHGVGSMCVVRTEGSAKQRVFRGHHSEVVCLCLHPDGGLVASGELGHGQTIAVWDARTLSEAARLDPGHGIGVCGLKFSTTGRRLASVGLDQYHSLVVWSWPECTKLATAFGSQDKVFSLAFDPTDELVVTCGVRHLKFWAMEEGRLVGRKGELSGPTSVLSCAWLEGKDGPELITGTQDGFLDLWARGRCIGRAEGHKGAVLDLCTGQDATTVVSGGQDGFVRMWCCGPDDKPMVLRQVELRTASAPRKALRELRPVAGIHTVFQRDGRLLVGTRAAELLTVHGMFPPQQEAEVRTWSAADSAWSRQGSLDDLAAVRVQRVACGHVGAVRSMAMDPASPGTLLTIGDDGSCRRWSADGDGEEVLEAWMGAGPTCVSYAPDGSLVAVGLQSGVVLLLQAASLHEVRAVDVAKEEGSLRRAVAVVALRFDGSGGSLAVAFADGGAAVMAVQGGWIVALPADAPDRATEQRPSHILGLDWSKNGCLLRAHGGGGAGSSSSQAHSPGKLTAARSQIHAAETARTGEWVKVWSLSTTKPSKARGGRTSAGGGSRSRPDLKPEPVLVLRVKDGGTPREEVWWESEFVGELVGVSWAHSSALAVPRVLEALQTALPSAPHTVSSVTSDSSGRVLCIGGDTGSVWTVTKAEENANAPSINFSSHPAHSTPVGQVQVASEGHMYSIGKQEGHLVEWRRVVRTAKTRGR